MRQPLNKSILVFLAATLTLPITGWAQTLIDPSLQYRFITTVNDAATNMAFIGRDDLLVLKKNSGEVVRVANGTVLGPVLDVSVNSFSGRGLLGVALHPNFAINSFVYLYYSKSATPNDIATREGILDNRIERYRWNGNALVEPKLIISLPGDPDGLHVGGIITFGPDRKLYAVMGYNDRNGKLQNNTAGAEPDDTGVVLRLNDDGTIPPDNPFFAQGGNLAKYFAYGIRNSFGMAFDPVSGKLWMTDNGDENYDEINLVLPGLNSGWARLMGPQARTPGATANLFNVPGSHYADPKFSWFESVAPTAILFMSSSQLGAQYLNNAFVADYNAGRLYRFPLNPARDGFSFQSPGLADRVADNDTELGEVLFGFSLGLLTDLKLSPDGKLYLLRLDGGIVVIEKSVPANLTVDVFFPTPSGFDVVFSKSVDVAALNLYDNEARQFGSADVTLVGAATGPVRGSLAPDPTGEVITFVKTSGVLLPDSYTVTLRSAANGFKDTDGNLLDGNGDGVAGDNFVRTFTVSPFNAVVVSMPDFSYGPGQTVNVPFNKIGVPVNLSNGAGITTMDMILSYDSNLLTLNGVEDGADSPAGAVTLIVDTSLAGTIRVGFVFPTPLSAGPKEIMRLTGVVPTTASYKAVNLLIFDSVTLNEGAIESIVDDALHVVAYIGDATGNGGYSSLDGQRILRVVSGLDTGFVAYPFIDPVIVGDTTWNGSLSSLDATRVLQEVAGLDRPEIPPIPSR